MRSKLLLYLLLTLGACLLLNGCATVKKPRVVRFEKTSFENMDGWEEDNHSWALEAFKESCKKILKAKTDKAISRLTHLGGTVKDWHQPCIAANSMENPSDEEAKEFFEEWFIPYKTTDEEHNPKGTLTGYYQIELEGSKKKHGKYKYPVYKKPKDLASYKGSSSIQHDEINKGALAGKNLEVAWVDNRARLYFMHIQGSGVVKLKEGGEMYLGFDEHNGYRFKGISEQLKERGLKLSSANQMMDWLHKNPEECHQIIGQDPSYVFFKKSETQSAVGGQGVPLHPERSLAVDCGLYPYGAPVWVDSQLPGKIYGGRDYKRLFIAQDTGGAIRGAVRGDVFFGRGDKAEKYAGSFKVPTMFYVLFPKTVRVPEIYSSM